ncbi:MAG: hypothetical protein BECKG1743F_GA0114225_102895, partial [Candidatus Kentron sp. G]
DSSLTHSTLQLRATMSAIRHPCLIMGQCPSNFEGRNTPNEKIRPFAIDIDPERTTTPVAARATSQGNEKPNCNLPPK